MHTRKNEHQGKSTIGANGHFEANGYIDGHGDTVGVRGVGVGGLGSEELGTTGLGSGGWGFGVERLEFGVEGFQRVEGFQSARGVPKSRA